MQRRRLTRALQGPSTSSPRAWVSSRQASPAALPFAARKLSGLPGPGASLWPTSCQSTCGGSLREAPVKCALPTCGRLFN